jgi:glycosyltransferase involved in cell wall biosynthesis
LARRTVFINGRFLTQNLGGVQRFCREVVKALDAQLQQGNCLLGDLRWVLLMPQRAECSLQLRRIEVQKAGGLSGHLWEQVQLPRLAAGGILVNLANSAPLAHRRSLTVLHDAMVYRIPHSFSFFYRSFHQLLGRLIVRRTQIGTVSEFSRGELAAIFGIDPATVFLVPNSCEHIAAVAPDGSVLQRLGLEPGRYFLLVGTPAPNKNMERAIAAFAALRRDGQRFVLVGAGDPAVYGRTARQGTQGVILAGRVADAELVALYRHATALVFPSLYEGFGIPPLEAMLHGCPVLASRIPPVEEVCGEAAQYFDPLSVAAMTEAMRSVIDHTVAAAALRDRGRVRAASFSWPQTAGNLLRAIADVEMSGYRRPLWGGVPVSAGASAP